MRSEGFPFIVGGLGVGAVFAWLASCRRLSSSSRLKFAAIGGSFCKRLCLDVSRVSLRRYSIVICVTRTCRARNVMHFAAQAQRFVRSADYGAVPLGLAFGESCFWGVGCGRAIGICVSGCGIEALFS